MKDYSYLFVIAGFVVLLDGAFLLRGHRRKSAHASTASSGSMQLAIPLEEGNGERRSGTERRHHATAQ
jgi:hypothetical protein